MLAISPIERVLWYQSAFRPSTGASRGKGSHDPLENAKAPGSAPCQNLDIHPFTECLSMAQASRSKSLSTSGFNEYNNQLQSAALKATRNAASLPPDLNFYRSLDRGLTKEADACSARVLALANKLLGLVATAEDSSGRPSKGKARLRDDEDVTDGFRSSVVDAMDLLLERAVSQHPIKFARGYTYVHLLYYRTSVSTKSLAWQSPQPSL